MTGTRRAIHSTMPKDKTPAGFRNVSTPAYVNAATGLSIPAIEAYETLDGNARIQHGRGRMWMITPRGREPVFANGSLAHAASTALALAADIAKADADAKSRGIGTVIESKYGTREIVGYEGHRGAWRRLEIYRPHNVPANEPWNREQRERPFCLNDRDVSPVVSTYAAQLGETGPHVRQYDAACSCCYLGYAHTVAKHDAMTAKGAA